MSYIHNVVNAARKTVVTRDDESMYTSRYSPSANNTYSQRSSEYRYRDISGEIEAIERSNMYRYIVSDITAK